MGKFIKGDNFMTPKVMTKISVFKGRQVRRILVKGEWWFSVIDVVAVLTDSDNPRDYWYKMKIREKAGRGLILCTRNNAGAGLDAAS